jgi:hypothetical protein
MFSREITEEYVLKSRTIDRLFPISYSHLFGSDRLAVLPVLSGELQTKLHMIVQQNVDLGTKCVRNDCCGVLNKIGSCSEKCEQNGNNIVDDIVNCKNCDTCCFPCKNCSVSIFNNEIRSELEDY